MVGHDHVIRGDGAVSLDGAENAKSYEAMASDYDRQLVDWGYEAPERAVGFLKAHLPSFENATILDCGCGTGMTGRALRQAGAEGRITGLDLSTSSLDIARKKSVYDDLRVADLNQPLEMRDDSVDGVLCVGVFSYIREDSLLREWKRVIRSGGIVVFTSRDDFFDSRGVARTLERLNAEDGWSTVHISEPLPYLPRHPEFAETIRVIHGVCRVE